MRRLIKRSLQGLFLLFLLAKYGNKFSFNHRNGEPL
jgi:hypothetical protein